CGRGADTKAGTTSILGAAHRTHRNGGRLPLSERRGRKFHPATPAGGAARVGATAHATPDCRWCALDSDLFHRAPSADPHQAHDPGLVPSPSEMYGSVQPDLSRQRSQSAAIAATVSTVVAW